MQLLILGGILKEPLTISENKTLNAVSWSKERPGGDINIKDSFTKVYEGDILVNHTTFIGKYLDCDSHYGESCVQMHVNVTASISGGFINFVNITLWEDYEISQIEFFEDHAWPKYFAYAENLSITRLYDFRLGHTPAGSKI